MDLARADRILRLKIPLYAAAAVFQVAGVYLGLLWAPILSTGFSSPVAQRIFYFHLGAAIASYAGFSVTLVASLLYLKKGDLFFDSLSRDSAALGLAFALMVLTSGPLWGYAEWGTPWRFDDARLMTYLTLGLVFVGYFAVRRSIANPVDRARSAALYSIVGYLLVPLSFVSVLIFRSLHPRVVLPGGGGLGPEGGMVVGICVIASMLLFVALLLSRTELSLLAAKVERLQREVDA